MTERPVHFRVEVLYDTTWGPCCGFDAPGRLTDDPAEVTCPECIDLCGFEQLTETQGDPFLNKRRAA